ncbi:nuclear transport factor 2 family protein [Terrarubrum flagellatum]|uniref:nuclear transport factor 2 family protein n=1 Tax=Terrirubrum flagellatum TaxID=2895980 RepID=UPI003144F01F
MSASALELFELQIRYILDDDRDAQLALLADDCVWEFPFAGDDRPRKIVGRDEFAQVMKPLWEAARRANIGRLSYMPLTIHETADPDLIIAEFEFGAGGHSLIFVQVFRTRNGKIAHVREYADYAGRARLMARNVESATQ